MARRLFPGVQDDLKLKKHHDRAEALLLAYTALAETQGCIIEPKLMKFGNLVDIYLAHCQRTENRRAKITDILDLQLPLEGTITEDIKNRKK